MNLREYGRSLSKKIVDVRPGEMFERPCAMAPDSAYRCMKLRNQVYVNVFTMTLVTCFDQQEVVTVIGSMG